MKISKTFSLVFSIIILYSLQARIKRKNNPEQSKDYLKCWIEKKFKRRGEMSIKNMILPATHYSGFWTPKTTEVSIENNLYFQYYTFEEQLNLGIRLFDFRFSLKNPNLENPVWQLQYKDFTNPDLDIFSMFQKAVHFLKYTCKNDFIILKIKLRSGIHRKNKWTKNLLSSLDSYDVDTQKIKDYLYFNLQNENIPKYEDIKGKIWIIPEGDFDLSTIKEHFNLNDKPKNWKKTIKEGHNVSVFGANKKINEFNNWVRKVNANQNDLKKLDYYGFNINYYSGNIGGSKKIKDHFKKNLEVDPKFNSVFNDIFILINERNAVKPLRGVIGMDFATVDMITNVVDLNNGRL